MSSHLISNHHVDRVLGGNGYLSLRVVVRPHCQAHNGWNPQLQKVDRLVDEGALKGCVVVFGAAHGRPHERAAAGSAPEVILKQRRCSKWKDHCLSCEGDMAKRSYPVSARPPTELRRSPLYVGRSTKKSSS